MVKLRGLNCRASVVGLTEVHDLLDKIVGRAAADCRESVARLHLGASDALDVEAGE